MGRNKCHETYGKHPKRLKACLDGVKR